MPYFKSVLRPAFNDTESLFREWREVIKNAVEENCCSEISLIVILVSKVFKVLKVIA